MACDFSDKLRFFPPASGGWNLAHIVRLVPECHVVFITPMGCSRVIALSALDRGLEGMFSYVTVSSNDIISGGLEEKMTESVRAILSRLPSLPRALLLFTSCVDGFTGTDHEAVFSVLGTEFPSVRFLDCRMDPINRKDGVPPIVRMQSAVASLFEGGRKERAVNFIGSFLPPKGEQELAAHLHKNGFDVRHAYSRRDFDALRAMGRSEINIVTHASAVPAARELSARLGQPYFSIFAPDPFIGTGDVYNGVTARLEIPKMDIPSLASACENGLSRCAKALSGRPVALDDGACHAPFTVAKLLLERGFNVRYVFADDCLKAEESAMEYVSARSTIVRADAPGMARAFASGEYRDPDITALGETAAYFTGTEHYAPRLGFTGDAGFYGLADAAGSLVDAMNEKKPLVDIRRNIGRGCAAL